MWDWADPKAYMHDEIASDKRNPTVNANGPMYGALEESADYLRRPRSEDAHRDPDQADGSRAGYAELCEYAAGGGHHPTGPTKRSGTARRPCTASRWTSRRACGLRRAVRKPATPAWCRAGSDHPSAKLFPINQGQRGLQLYDPKTKQVTTIDTCFTWGHVNFDDNDVLWSSFGPAGVEGWFDTRIWDKTHDEKQAQGWTRVRPRLQR